VKALVKVRAEPGLWLQDVPDPTPGRGEVLIRVLRTGICGTDLHIESWNEWAQTTIHPPLVVGHEFVGEIVDSGFLAGPDYGLQPTTQTWSVRTDGKTQPGTYNYWCSVHDFMHGEVLIGQ